MRQHLYCMDLYNSLWGCATFGLHNILQQLLLCYLLDGSIYLVPSTYSFCMQTRECQLFLQVKSSFEDRVIASILGKSSDVAFRISVSEPSFYSLYFAVTLHDSKISFVLCQLSASIWLPIEKVLWKFPEDSWVCGRQFSYIKTNMSCNCSGCWMGWGGVGVDEHIGSFQYAMA